MKMVVVLLVLVVALAFAAPASAWTWPVSGPVVRGYTFGDDPYASGQHRGVDIGASVWTRVRAPVSGVVAFRGFVPSGGYTVTIETVDGHSVTLQQLDEIEVVTGASLAEGVVIGIVGDSSDPTTRQPHLHLGVRVSAERHGYVEPLSFLEASDERVGSASVPTEASTPPESQTTALGAERLSDVSPIAEGATDVGAEFSNELGSAAATPSDVPGGAPPDIVEPAARFERVVGAGDGAPESVSADAAALLEPDEPSSAFRTETVIDDPMAEADSTVAVGSVLPGQDAGDLDPPRSSESEAAAQS